MNRRDEYESKADDVVHPKQNEGVTEERRGSASSSTSKKKTTGPVHNSKYKAKLCKNWMTKGSCQYFEKCQFAHGQAELDKWTRLRLKYHEEQAQEQAERRHNNNNNSRVPSSNSTTNTWSAQCAPAVITEDRGINSPSLGPPTGPPTASIVAGRGRSASTSSATVPSAWPLPGTATLASKLSAMSLLEEQEKSSLDTSLCTSTSLRSMTVSPATSQPESEVADGSEMGTQGDLNVPRQQGALTDPKSPRSLIKPVSLPANSLSPTLVGNMSNSSATNKNSNSSNNRNAGITTNTTLPVSTEIPPPSPTSIAANISSMGMRVSAGLLFEQGGSVEISGSSTGRTPMVHHDATEFIPHSMRQRQDSPVQFIMAKPTPQVQQVQATPQQQGQYQQEQQGAFRPVQQDSFINATKTGEPLQRPSVSFAAMAPAQQQQQQYEQSISYHQQQQQRHQSIHGYHQNSVMYGREPSVLPPHQQHMPMVYQHSEYVHRPYDQHQYQQQHQHQQQQSYYPQMQQQHQQHHQPQYQYPVHGAQYAPHTSPPFEPSSAFSNHSKNEFNQENTPVMTSIQLASAQSDVTLPNNSDVGTETKLYSDSNVPIPQNQTFNASPSNNSHNRRSNNPTTSNTHGPMTLSELGDGEGEHDDFATGDELGNIADLAASGPQILPRSRAPSAQSVPALFGGGGGSKTEWNPNGSFGPSDISPFSQSFSNSNMRQQQQQQQQAPRVRSNSALLWGSVSSSTMWSPAGGTSGAPQLDNATIHTSLSGSLGGGGVNTSNNNSSQDPFWANESSSSAPFTPKSKDRYSENSSVTAGILSGRPSAAEEDDDAEWGELSPRGWNYNCSAQFTTSPTLWEHSIVSQPMRGRSHSTVDHRKMSSLLSGNGCEGGHRDGESEIDGDEDWFRRSLPVPTSRVRSKSEMLNPGFMQPHRDLAC